MSSPSETRCSPISACKPVIRTWGFWMASAGLLGLGLGAGAYGSSVLRRVRFARDKRPMIWATIGSAVLGAGAGASILASLLARRASPAAIESRE